MSCPGVVAAAGVFECSCECLLWKVLEGPTRRCQNSKRKEGAIEGKLHVPVRDLSVFTSYKSMARRETVALSRCRTLPTSGPSSLDLLVGLSRLVETARHHLIGRQLSINGLFVDLV